MCYNRHGVGQASAPAQGGRGKPEFHRAGRWVTPRRGDPMGRRGRVTDSPLPIRWYFCDARRSAAEGDALPAAADVVPRPEASGSRLVMSEQVPTEMAGIGEAGLRRDRCHRRIGREKHVNRTA